MARTSQCPKIGQTPLRSRYNGERGQTTRIRGWTRGDGPSRPHLPNHVAFQHVLCYGACTAKELTGAATAQGVNP